MATRKELYKRAREAYTTAKGWVVEKAKEGMKKAAEDSPDALYSGAKRKRKRQLEETSEALFGRRK